MIKRIFSKTEENKLLHLVCRASGEDMEPRTDVVGDKEFLQLAILNFDKGRTFVPHRHIAKIVPDTAIAQESWVVLRGRVKAIFYDLDDEVLCTEELDSGDISITLYGGHNYEILEDDTLVLEYKTGPYYGQKLDKVFIDE